MNIIRVLLEELKLIIIQPDAIIKVAKVYLIKSIN